MWVKASPSEHEKYLFARAQKYIKKLAWIPGIEMVAVVNSLSMYATHRDSDIDLFVVTKRYHLWFVRVMTTVVFFLSGVWRHGEDVAENFCLSFFVTMDTIDLSEIAIEGDIYLYYWVYYMKPILVRGDTYGLFLEKNTWVPVDTAIRIKNTEYAIEPRYNIFSYILQPFAYILDRIFCFTILPKTQKRYEQLWKPEGIIISDSMLKFHNHDRRREVRDAILKKNFDK